MNPDIKTKYIKNENKKILLDARKNQLLNQIVDSTMQKPAAEINQIYNAIENIDILKNHKNTIVLTPVYPKNKTTLLWPLLYFGFGCLIFVISKKWPVKINKK